MNAEKAKALKTFFEVFFFPPEVSSQCYGKVKLQTTVTAAFCLQNALKYCETQSFAKHCANFTFIVPFNPQNFSYSHFIDENTRFKRKVK